MKKNKKDRSYFDNNKSNKADYCFIYIKPHQGGLESRDFCSMMTRTIEKYAIKNKIQYQTIENTEYITILRLECHKNKINFLTGLHKIVRVSPFGKGDKVHTSLCKINVEGSKTKYNVQILEKDIRIDFFKSTGPGGQHRNKTMSAVRLVHLPTNIIVTSSTERSQHDNRKYAYEQLQMKLENLLNEKKLENKINERKNDKLNEKIIASYYFNHQIATNDISGQKTTNLKSLFNGDLEQIFN